MSWLKELLRAAGEPVLFGPIDEAAGGAARGELAVGACYVAANLRVAHIEFGRRGTHRLSAVTSASARLDSTWPGGSARLGGLALEGTLAALDPAHRGRVVSVGTSLFGPTPYRGGPLALEVGLFSRTDKDLAEPFLHFLGKLADVAAVPFVPAASTFLPLLDEGLALLQRAGGLELEAGAAIALERPVTGTYLVARARGRGVAEARLRADGVFWASDDPVTEPHLVFDLVSSDRRDDFPAVPELAEAWSELREAVRRERHDLVEQALARLRRTAVLSPDLLAADGDRLVTLAQDLAEKALPGGLTSAAPASGAPFPELADLLLYPARP